MVVEQEMAEIYPPEAEELIEYLPGLDCAVCGKATCLDFAVSLLAKNADPGQCPEMDRNFTSALTVILDLNTDPIPYNVMMEEEPCELIEVGGPDRSSPVLITCNFRETVRIMKETLERTKTPAFLLPTYTHGYSVDNAVPERMFKALEVWKALKENSLEDRVDRRSMIIPGLAEPEKNNIRQMTKWNVSVGPVSGFLVPLYILSEL